MYLIIIEPSSKIEPIDKGIPHIEVDKPIPRKIADPVLNLGDLTHRAVLDTFTKAINSKINNTKLLTGLTHDKDARILNPISHRMKNI
jgi:hypothetical protein